MNPYPLLLWLKEYGGSIIGGMEASYCEAPPEEPILNSSGTTPDLDTGDRNDARPSPVVEQNRDGQDSPEWERKSRTEEENEGTTEKSRATTATGNKKKVSSPGSSEKDDEGGDERGERATPGTVTLVPDLDLTSGPSTDEATRSDPSQAHIRSKSRALLEDPSPTDPVSPRSNVAGLLEMLRKAENKNECDGRDASAPDRKKQAEKEKQEKPKNS